ncbi:hypothetical protein ABEB36_012903 [Hypothenemus hampei]|uniref:Uncharacterized protein n=1 Tax=Hypothenemus hampei TaxID=57062 RepID=A0ABD1E660_HYPHA
MGHTACIVTCFLSKAPIQFGNCHLSQNSLGTAFHFASLGTGIVSLSSVSITARQVDPKNVKKWASLRGQLRRSLSKRKTKSGQSAAKIQKYKYEDVLEFLIPYLEYAFESVSESQESFSQETYPQENCHNLNKKLTENLNFVTITTFSPSEAQVLQNRNQFAKPTIPKRKISDKKPQDSPASQLMAYTILAQKEEEKENRLSSLPLESHPVDAFLGAIAPSLKTLSSILG